MPFLYAMALSLSINISNMMRNWGSVCNFPNVAGKLIQGFGTVHIKELYETTHNPAAHWPRRCEISPRSTQWSFKLREAKLSEIRLGAPLGASNVFFAPRRLPRALLDASWGRSCAKPDAKTEKEGPGIDFGSHFGYQCVAFLVILGVSAACVVSYVFGLNFS